MPDRDVVAKRIRSPWRPAARLWVREGPSALVIDQCRATLAKALRDGGPGLERARAEATRAGAHLDRDGRERLTGRLLLEQAVLAPLRDQRLIALDAAAVHREESALLDALAPDIARYAAQIASGERPRVRRRARPDVRRVLDSPVAIRL